MGYVLPIWDMVYRYGYLPHRYGHPLFRYGIWANDMGDDHIETVISHIDMGYLVTLLCPALAIRAPWRMARAAAAAQGLTLVHFSAQHKHTVWDTLGAWFSPSLLDRGTRGSVPKMAQVELKVDECKPLPPPSASPAPRQ